MKGVKCVEAYVISTHSQSAEVNRIAVRAVASLIASPDLEGVNGAWGQSSHSHRVGLSEHAGCTALVRALQRERSVVFFCTSIIPHYTLSLGAPDQFGYFIGFFFFY